MNQADVLFNISTYNLKIFPTDKQNEALFMSILLKIECQIVNRAQVIVKEKNDNLSQIRYRLVREVFIISLVIVGVIFLTLIFV